MRRGMAVVASLGLVLAACGGDDSDDAAATAVDTVDESESESESESGEPAAETDESTADTGGDDAGEADDAGDDAGDDGGDDDAGGMVIGSFDDIPPQCRDAMAEFLREIEPIVGDVDWQTATLADFETIGAQFEEISADFEADNAANGCDDLEFADDDDEFELLIEFASQEAPGTVGFLEFISDFGQAAEEMVGSADAGVDDGSGGDAPFTDCDGAVAFMERLMAEYDTFLDVPAAELMQFSALATVFPTCSPDQLDFFDSEEFNAFIGE